MKLKTHNQSYTEEQMKRLLQMVNRNNIIHNTNIVDTDLTDINTPNSVLTDILDTNEFDDYVLPFIQFLQEYLLTNNFENLDRFLVNATDRIQQDLIKILARYGTTNKKKELKNSTDFLTNMIHDNKINNINNLNYIKNCIKMIGVILPGMIKNSVVYDIKVHPNLDISGLHKDDILKISTEEYISIKKYYEDSALNNEFLTNIQQTFSQIILLSDKILINKSNFTYNVSLKLMKYLFILGVNKYIINSSELTIDLGSEVVELNAQKNLQNIKIASLLIDFIKILSNHQEKINISYEDIMNKIFKLKESEKNRIRKRTSDLSNEARKIDNEFKMLKIGEWGKGQNVTGYDGERYGEENAVMLNEQRMQTAALFGFDNPRPDAGPEDFDDVEDGDYRNDNDDNETD